jgi:hypothetical protein
MTYHGQNVLDPAISDAQDNESEDERRDGDTERHH